MPLGEEIPLERGHQRGVPPPLRNRYFTTIGSSSVKTVADRHRLAAYHNKHCRVSENFFIILTQTKYNIYISGVPLVTGNSTLHQFRSSVAFRRWSVHAYKCYYA